MVFKKHIIIFLFLIIFCLKGSSQTYINDLPTYIKCVETGRFPDTDVKIKYPLDLSFRTIEYTESLSLKRKYSEKALKSLGFKKTSTNLYVKCKTKVILNVNIKNDYILLTLSWISDNKNQLLLDCN